MTTECPICGKKMIIRDNSKNIRIIDGVIMHKKCPKQIVSSKEDMYELNLLREKINYYINNKPSPKGCITGYRWSNITKKIKDLKDQGYNYSDMLYALDEVVKLQGSFWGFGAVVNNIERLIYKRNMYNKLVEKADSTNEKEQIIDLKIMEDDIGW